MNNDETQTPGEGDHIDRDAGLDHWLSDADPARDCNTTDAVQRLQSFWEKQTPAASNETTPSSFIDLSNDKRLKHGAIVWQLSLAASVLLCVGIGWWMSRSIKDLPKVASGDLIRGGDTVSNATVVDLVKDPSLEGSLTRSTTPEIESPLVNSKPKKREKRILSIATVQHLRLELKDRKPNQRFPEIQLDEESLKGELGFWLGEWKSATPERREKLAATWNQNREYWLPWAKQWCGSWQNEQLSVAAIEVVAADERSNAVPFLFTLVNKETLRRQAWVQICRYGNVEQLSRLAPIAGDCDEIQALAAALINDASAQATDLLASISIDPGCRQAIKQLQIAWPDSHAKHCWNRVIDGSDELDAEAANLLAIIPSAQIDTALGHHINSRQNVIAAVSILLIRDTPTAGKLLSRVRSNRILVGNLPSAEVQLVRWSLYTSQSPFLSKKVCEKCSVSS